ncbi:MAG: translesion DNA synthesis-associated protein ImuA [Pseudomarimonas sp.]
MTVSSVLALDALLRDPRLWRGRASAPTTDGQTTGHAELDAALPSGGWPQGALSEVLIAADGIGELRLLLPTIARLTRVGTPVLLVAPPYQPYAAAWSAAGVELAYLHMVTCAAKEALWTTEQALRSAACGAVLCWPGRADDRALRRLQVAAESGRCLGFCTRPSSVETQPSPAALRLRVEATGATAVSQIRVLKCRGGLPPVRPIALSALH